MELQGRPELLKNLNTGIVKEALRQMGTATRIEISAHTGLSQPTVNQIVKRLLTDGTIISKGFALSSGGRRAETYSLNLDSFCYLAVIVETNQFKYGVANLDGAVISSDSFNIKVKKNYYDQLCKLIDRSLAANANIKAIGVSVPGAVSDSGNIFAIPLISEWEELPLEKLLTEKYKIPFMVENDIKTIAYGYSEKVLKDNKADVVFVHVGAGIGAGIVVGGRIVKGFSSFAGEIGYLTTGQVPTQTDSKIGAFEELLSKPHDNKQLVEILANNIINIISILNPSYIVLGGSKVNQDIIDDIKKICIGYLPKVAVPSFKFIKDEDKYCKEGLWRKAMTQSSKDLRIVRLDNI